MLSLHVVRHQMAYFRKDNMNFFESREFDGTLVSNGRLMDPCEVQEAIHRRQGIPGLFPGWCLCGDTRTTMFDAVVRQGDGADVRLSGFVGPANGAYATITHQVGGMQHRFLLPLFEPPVIAFLQATERQPIQTMLGREGQTQALMLHNALPRPNIRPLVAMCQPARRVGLDMALEEMCETLRALCRPETIPSIYKGVALTGVSVSVIVPAQYCLAADKQEVVAPGEPK